MEFIISQTYLHLILLFIGFLVINELCRRSKWFVVFLIILPIVQFPFYDLADIGVFPIIKLYSVVFAMLWLLLMRYTRLGENKIGKIGFYLIVISNIVEAVVIDTASLTVVGLINALAGVLLIFTLRGVSKIQITKDQFKDLVWPDMNKLWVVAYIVWNWVFVYLNYPMKSSFHLMVLLAASLATYFSQKASWIQARTYTLAAILIYFDSFMSLLDKYYLDIPKNEVSVIILASLSLIINLINAYFLFNKTNRLNRSLFV